MSKSNLRIHVPHTRAPRLPRDHFAMRPPTTLLSRIIQAVVVVGAVIVIVMAIGRHAG